MEGVLFDFNGTLIFDNDINFKAWRETCEKIRGTPMTWEEYQICNGQPFKGFMNFILKRECTKEEEKFGVEKEALYRKYLAESNIQLADGAIQLFEEMKAKNVPFNIATSSNKENVDLYVEKFGLGKWFDVSKICYSDGTFKGKPNPDIYLTAAKKIGVDAKKCIIFEDAKSGIQAGVSAEGKVIGLTSSLTKEELESIKGVVKGIKDFTEVNVEILKSYFN